MHTTDTQIVMYPRDPSQSREITRRPPGLTVADATSKSGRVYAWIVPDDAALLKARGVKSLCEEYGAQRRDDGRVTVDGAEAVEAVIAGLVEIHERFAARAASPKRSAKTLPDVAGIEVRERPERIEIRCAPDPERNARIRQIRTSTWDRDARCWTVGTRYRASVVRWLEAEAADVTARSDVPRAERRERALTALERACGTSHVPGITVDGGGSVTIRSDYDDELVELLRAASGAWDADLRIWTLRWDRAEAAGEQLSRIGGILVEQQHARAVRETARRERAAAERAARQAARAEEGRANDQVRAERRASRVLVSADQAPAEGETLRRGGAVLAVTGLGRTFRADEDLASMGHTWLLGREGVRVRYVYTRPASAEEVAAHEAAEREHEQVARVVRERREAVGVVARGEIAPDTGEAPAGRELWRDDSSAPVGYRTWVVEGDDGWLYHLTYDGADGAAWGRFNAGYNTRAHRVRSTPELVGAITGQAP